MICPFFKKNGKVKNNNKYKFQKFYSLRSFSIRTFNFIFFKSNVNSTNDNSIQKTSIRYLKKKELDIKQNVRTNNETTNSLSLYRTGRLGRRWRRVGIGNRDRRCVWAHRLETLWIFFWQPCNETSNWNRK